MPENYYWYYDNFFQKVTNMESPRKNNDCYFYYYSTCTKGDNCTFRHEPSALGCETVCSFWKEGKCLNVHCSFRHMELRKNRKAIPCYWETQTSGCLKPHCPFLHKSAKDSTSDSLGSSDLQSPDITKALGQSGSKNNDSDRKSNQFSETNYGSPTVDSLVVNFEEESDNEYAPTHSPAKSNQARVVTVKTLEEIRLEKVQAESAAYYFYPGVEEMTPQSTTELQKADDLRNRILQRLNLKTEESSDNFEILSLDQIRRHKKRNADFEPTYPATGGGGGVADDDRPKTKRQKFSLQRKTAVDVSDIKIKTLAEIRAEKMSKKMETQQLEDTCSEVTSTSNSEDPLEKPSEEIVEKPAKRKRNVEGALPIKKIKLQRLKLDRAVVESTLDDKTSVTDVEPAKEDRNEDLVEPMVAEENAKQVVNNNVCDKNNREDDSTKLDDILLLDDEDMEEHSINLKAEDDILKDIDDLLND